jgi:enoyl-CoA hydratase/carnithine racemase
VDDEYAELLLDRPDKLNALDLEMSHLIAQSLDEVPDAIGSLDLTSSTPGMLVAEADIAAPVAVA